MSWPFGRKVAARAHVLSGLTNQIVRTLSCGIAGRSWNSTNGCLPSARGSKRVPPDPAKSSLPAMYHTRAPCRSDSTIALYSLRSAVVPERRRYASTSTAPRTSTAAVSPARAMAGRRRLEVRARGTEDALAERGPRFPERHGVGQRADHLGESRSLSTARSACREVRRDALRVGLIQRAERVGLEIVEDVVVHRDRSSARRIF